MALTSGKCENCDGGGCDACGHTGWLNDEASTDEEDFSEEDDPLPRKHILKRLITPSRVAWAAVIAIGISAVISGKFNDKAEPLGDADAIVAFDPDTIMACQKYEGLYKYINLRTNEDFEIVYSPTPPESEVDNIEESFSTGKFGKILNQARILPRDSVKPLGIHAGEWFDYVKGQRVTCEKHFYVPPSTASGEEKGNYHTLLQQNRSLVHDHSPFLLAHQPHLFPLRPPL
jgi:hypothetical protein